MPTAGFAGHLGDTWNFFRPVLADDAIRVVHKPLSCVRTRSRPEMAVVRFGLQMVNQRDVVVQDGEVSMMIPGRGSGQAVNE
jgi:acyl dehydratase